MRPGNISRRSNYGKEKVKPNLGSCIAVQVGSNSRFVEALFGASRRRAGCQLVPMPRMMRAEYPGANYHLMNRGDRREIFVDDVDRQDFLKTLAEAPPSGCRVPHKP